VVTGAGGLGHVGIAVLRAVTGATVIALDISDEKQALASEVGRTPCCGRTRPRSRRSGR
jgi:propanol-preferring alcohol dehydrogenase